MPDLVQNYPDRAILPASVASEQTAGTGNAWIAMDTGRTRTGKRTASRSLHTVRYGYLSDLTVRTDFTIGRHGTEIYLTDILRRRS